MTSRRRIGEDFPVFLFNLAHSVDNDVLDEWFGKFGVMTTTPSVQRNADGSSRGFAFINYKTLDAAQAAVAAMHGTTHLGHLLKVQLKSSHSAGVARTERIRILNEIVVHNLPPSTTMNDIRELFQPYGDVVSPPQITTGLNDTKSVTIRFIDPASSQSSIDKLNGTEFKGYLLRVLRQKKETCIVVSNLAPETTEDELYHHFKPCGLIISAHIHRLSVGFVNFNEQSGANTALNTLDQSLLHGEKIHLQMKCEGAPSSTTSLSILPGAKTSNVDAIPDCPEISWRVESAPRAALAIGESRDPSRQSSSYIATRRKSYPIYLHNVATDTTKKELFDLFAKFGEIRSVAFSTEHPGLAFVNIYEEEGVQAIAAAKAVCGVMLHGQAIMAFTESVYHCLPPAISPPAPSHPTALPIAHHATEGTSYRTEEKALFVVGLLKDVTNDYLCEWFGKYAAVSDAKVMRYDNGLSRGFGFVNMRTVEGAQAAINALHDTHHGGRLLTVQFKTKTPQTRPPSPTIISPTVQSHPVVNVIPANHSHPVVNSIPADSSHPAVNSIQSHPVVNSIASTTPLSVTPEPLVIAMNRFSFSPPPTTLNNMFSNGAKAPSIAPNPFLAVIDLLNKAKLSEHISALGHHQIESIEDLKCLDTTQMQALGITKIGHCLRLKRALAEYTSSP